MVVSRQRTGTTGHNPQTRYLFHLHKGGGQGWSKA